MREHFQSDATLRGSNACAERQAAPQASRDAVHIWRVDLRCSPSQLGDFWTVLSQDERDRASRIKAPLHRRRFVKARAALKGIIGQYLDDRPENIELVRNAHGKPELEATARGNLTFNLSHVDDLMLVAISAQRRIGVDVDRARPNLPIDDVARLFLSRQEIAHLRATPCAQRDEAFLRRWTRMEAFAKAVGVGMATAVTQLGITTEGQAAETEVWVSSFEESVPWHLVDVSVGIERPYVASLCVEGGGWILEHRLWHD